MASNILYIGLDIGSTFSDLAWAISSPNCHLRMQHIRIWPSGEARCGKVPTALRYIHSTVDSDPVRWGFTAQMPEASDPESLPVLFFKLLMYPAVDMPCGAYNYAEFAAGQCRRSIQGLMTDYIRELLRQGMSQWDAYSLIPWVISLAVPEQTTLDHKVMLKGAVRAAAASLSLDNVEKVLVVSEPEAAALGVLDVAWRGGDFRDQKPALGESFVVMDAGGVTIDMVTYHVIGTSPTKITQISPAKSVLAGSIFANEEMRSFAMPSLQALSSGQLAAMAKMTAQGTELFSGDPSLSPNQRREMYTGLLERAHTALAEQMNFASSVIGLEANVKFIYVVGGFASNDELFNSIATQFGGTCSVLRARHRTRPSAAAHGAVLCALNYRARSVHQPGLITAECVVWRSRASFGIIVEEQPGNSSLTSDSEVKWLIETDDKVYPWRESETTRYTVTVPPGVFVVRIRFCRSARKPAPPPTFVGGGGGESKTTLGVEGKYFTQLLVPLPSEWLKSKLSDPDPLGRRHLDLDIEGRLLARTDILDVTQKVLIRVLYQGADTIPQRIVKFC